LAQTLARHTGHCHLAMLWDLAASLFINDSAESEARAEPCKQQGQTPRSPLSGCTVQCSMGDWINGQRVPQVPWLPLVPPLPLVPRLPQQAQMSSQQGAWPRAGGWSGCSTPNATPRSPKCFISEEVSSACKQRAYRRSLQTHTPRTVWTRAPELSTIAEEKPSDPARCVPSRKAKPSRGRVHPALAQAIAATERPIDPALAQAIEATKKSKIKRHAEPLKAALDQLLLSVRIAKEQQHQERSCWELASRSASARIRRCMSSEQARRRWRAGVSSLELHSQHALASALVPVPFGSRDRQRT